MAENGGTQPIETTRLLLRRFTAGDAAEMHQNWTGDAEVTRWLTWDAHTGPEETAGILRQWEEGYAAPDFYLWGIVEKASGALIGSIGVLRFTGGPEGPVWEPGYCIGRRWWGKGYTTEALAAALDFYDKHGKEPSLYCRHAKSNPASGRVMEKNGFRYLNDTTYRRVNGEVVPAKLYIREKPWTKTPT